MRAETGNMAPGVGGSVVSEYERVVGLEVRRATLKHILKITPDIVARVKICQCGVVFVSKRRGKDVKWCKNCK